MFDIAAILKWLWWAAGTTAGKAIIILGLVYGYGAYQHHAGRAEANHEWNTVWKAHKKADAKAAKAAKDKQDAVNKATGDAFRALSEQLEQKAKEKAKVRTIIKTVTKYVTPQADSRAVIPAGFVWLHNVAATDDPELASRPPADVDAPSGVALSTVADTIKDNYAECNERGTIIAGWQTWYLKNQAIWAKYGGPEPPSQP